MFKDAKVGDKVWSLLFGWGKVVRFGDYPYVKYPVEVEHDTGTNQWYSTAGQRRDDQNPTLFWNEVKIVPPPKPAKVYRVFGLTEASAECLRGMAGVRIEEETL